LTGSAWTFAAQFNYSQNATEEFSPLEYFPQETLDPTHGTIATTATSSSILTLMSSLAAGSSSMKDLFTGGIVGVTIGGLAVLILACLLIYMHGQQKATGEILEHSQVPSQAVHSSYVTPSPDTREANSNMQKVGFGDVNYLGGKWLV
jgi:hypothetical protein